jgi:myo-inositol-hexaphosphate 3-phosphohydrolase
LHGAQEEGVWRYAAEPDGSTEGTHVAAVGENGFRKDAEGITIDDGKTFQIVEVDDTDGVDVTHGDPGPDVPYGLFVCHDDGKSSQPVVTAFEDLGLETETSYDPRAGTYNIDQSVRTPPRQRA